MLTILAAIVILLVFVACDLVAENIGYGRVILS